MTTLSDRQFLGLTQEQAAGLAGVSVATWRRWEHDPASVSKSVRAQCDKVIIDGDEPFGGLWDELQPVLAIVNAEDSDTPAGMMAKLGEVIKANEHLRDICYELLAMNMKPTPQLRSRFGMAVMRAKLCEVLAEDGGTSESAMTAVHELMNRVKRPTAPTN